MTMNSWYADTAYNNPVDDDDDNDWLCIIFKILTAYQLLVSLIRFSQYY